MTTLLLSGMFLHLFLAPNINLLTHYAKGTLSFFFTYFKLELLIKLLFQIFPLRYLFAIAYISYLALEKGFPRFKQIISVLLKRLFHNSYS